MHDLSDDGDDDFLEQDNNNVNSSIKKPGEVRFEDSIKIRGQYIDDLIENIAYEETEIISDKESKSCLYFGVPGCGKTEMLKDNYKLYSKNEEEKGPIVFTFTNKACDVLRTRGVMNVHTFDSYFYRENNYNKIDKCSIIMVDEFSMLPSKFIAQFIELRRNIIYRFNCTEIVINVNQ